mmetsp:Transcript_29238/g.68065  ORF Transcript_29238/g.68065 Transcript_29238/m.68065 type:complete len:90 (-) Transcript_29238:644-913(-)
MRDGIEDVGFLTTLQNLAESLVFPSEAKYTISEMHPNGSIVQHALDLLEHGTLKAVIDRTYNLKDVPLAHDYLEQGHATGKVVFDHGVV